MNSCCLVLMLSDKMIKVHSLWGNPRSHLKIKFLHVNLRSKSLNSGWSSCGLPSFIVCIFIKLFHVNQTCSYCLCFLSIIMSSKPEIEIIEYNNFRYDSRDENLFLCKFRWSQKGEQVYLTGNFAKVKDIRKYHTYSPMMS